jgi:hypothetical protein
MGTNTLEVSPEPASVLADVQPPRLSYKAIPTMLVLTIFSLCFSVVRASSVELPHSKNTSHPPNNVLATRQNAISKPYRMKNNFYWGDLFDKATVSH